MRLHRLCAVLLAPLALAAGCGTGEDAPAADPPAGRSSLRGDSAAVAAKPAAREDHVLLAVDWPEEGGTVAEVFAVIPAAGGFAEPEIDDSASAARFYARWLGPGRGYTLLRGGWKMGTLTITENDAQGCMALTAIADAVVEEPGPHRSAIATDAPVPASRLFVGTPSTGERWAINALLMRAIGSTGHAWSRDDEMKSLRVTLPGDGVALVGSVVARPPGADADQRALAAAFVIAERGATGEPRPVITWTHARGGEEAEDEQFERVFVDAADLDGDRIPEIVARTALTESWEYIIYKRGPHGWAEVYRYGGGGC